MEKVIRINLVRFNVNQSDYSSLDGILNYPRSYFLFIRCSFHYATHLWFLNNIVCYPDVVSLEFVMGHFFFKMGKKLEAETRREKKNSDHGSHGSYCFITVFKLMRLFYKVKYHKWRLLSQLGLTSLSLSAT